MVAAFACLGAVAILAVERTQDSRLVFRTTTSALALPVNALALDPSIAAEMQADLPLLQELWSSGGGPSAGIHYVRPPEGIRAGQRLRVDIDAITKDGSPFSEALVEVVWALGSLRYKDIAYTDSMGRVTLQRTIDKGCRGERCVVAVRMFRDDLQALAYSEFTPR